MFSHFIDTTQEVCSPPSREKRNHRDELISGKILRFRSARCCCLRGKHTTCFFKWTCGEYSTHTSFIRYIMDMAIHMNLGFVCLLCPQPNIQQWINKCRCTVPQHLWDAVFQLSQHIVHSTHKALSFPCTFNLLPLGVIFSSRWRPVLFFAWLPSEGQWWHRHWTLLLAKCYYCIGCLVLLPL